MSGRLRAWVRRLLVGVAARAAGGALLGLGAGVAGTWHRAGWLCWIVPPLAGAAGLLAGLALALAALLDGAARRLGLVLPPRLRGAPGSAAGRPAGILRRAGWGLLFAAVAGPLLLALPGPAGR